MLLVLVQVADHGQGGFFVLFAFGQFQQFARLGQAVEDRGDAADGLVQIGAFAAKVLGVLGVVPDIRVFQFPGYFFQTLFLGVVVKDTP
ncbi:hypothetical protein HMPREF3113_12175 [Stenotrophomonas sp. HMSC10F06]|nr:hypothetical protein HMPREF3113_12175 [Stenotrophomonas sp. HMSC10F06]